jgi:RNA 3'-terminal phosphate cyclase
MECLIPFTPKSNSDALFLGITNGTKGPSVDTFRMSTLHMLKHFGVPIEGLELKIDSRGCPPLGGGGVSPGSQYKQYTDSMLIYFPATICHFCCVWCLTQSAFTGSKLG